MESTDLTIGRTAPDFRAPTGNGRTDAAADELLASADRLEVGLTNRGAS